jgi:hypothetical protein
MSTISSGGSGLTWTSDATGNLVFSSNVTLGTIVDSTGNTVTSTTVVKGSAKAWVVYTSTGQLILNSFNVSSVTYNGTGDFTINFTTAMPTTNYAVVCSRDAASGAGPYTANRYSGGTYSTTAVRIIVMSSTAVGNFDGCSVAIFS